MIETKRMINAVPARLAQAKNAQPKCKDIKGRPGLTQCRISKAIAMPMKPIKDRENEMISSLVAFRLKKAPSAPKTKQIAKAKSQ